MAQVGKWITRVLVIVCCLFTVLVGGFLLANGQNVLKMVNVIKLIDQNFLGESSVEGMFEGAIAGVVDSLGDKYSVYYNKEETARLYADIQGSFGGIGVMMRNEDGKVVVVSTVEDSVSEKAGICAGDIIVGVNGEDVTGLEIDQVVARVRGDIGSEVQVSVFRSSEQKTYDYTLIREKVEDVSVNASFLEEGSDIAYVRITKFTANTCNEVVRAVNKLTAQHGIRGIIMDLRSNSGGEMYSAVDLARLFVPAGPVVHIVEKDGETMTLSADGEPQIKVPLVVLIDGYTASASEIFAGAIKDTQVGVLVGTKTFGKGIVQGVHFLKDGSSVKLTHARYLTPNKNDIHQVGIEPDISCPFPEDMTAKNFQDVQLDKAIEVLQNMLAY